LTGAPADWALLVDVGASVLCGGVRTDSAAFGAAPAAPTPCWAMAQGTTQEAKTATCARPFAIGLRLMDHLRSLQQFIVVF
jgi:hypothetical protein